MKLPVCLCDRYVDFMRSCYRTKMFFPGAGEVEIQYYFTPPNAKPLRFPTCYNSLNWWDGPDRPPGTPGEVQGAPRKWVDGRDPGGECDGVKGDADAWRGRPAPLIECIKNPMAKGGIEIGGRSIHTIRDQFIAGDGGVEVNGAGDFVPYFSGDGGVSVNGEGSWFTSWIGDGGVEVNGAGDFVPYFSGDGGVEVNGEGDFVMGGDDMPIGAIYWFGNTTPPADHLVCDGSAVSRSTYATLFGIIGSTFGGGDGSTTFNLPNIASRSVVGSGTGSGLSARTLAATGGEENHTLSTAEIPAHSHAQQSNTLLDNAGAASVVSGIGAARLIGGTTGNAGGGGGHNTMHPFVVLVPIIRYQ